VILSLIQHNLLRHDTFHSNILYTQQSANQPQSANQSLLPTQRQCSKGGIVFSSV